MPAEGPGQAGGRRTGGGSPVLTTSYWPAEASVPLDEITVGDLLRRVAAQVPDRIALVDGQAEAARRRRWSYAELLAVAEDVAGALLARFEPGERVAVWEANRPEWVMLQLGAALAGVILVTVNPQYRSAELKYALAQSGVAGLVHGTSHRGVSMVDVVSALRPELPALREVVCFADWDEFAASGGPGPRPLPQLKPTDPALIIYTSGTTGFAKGALLHHLGLVNAAGLSAQRAGFQDGDTWINPIPLFHTGGGVLAGIGCLARRAAHVVVPQFDPGPGPGADRGGAGQHGAHRADHPAGHAREPRPAAARPVLAAHGDVGRRQGSRQPGPPHHADLRLRVLHPVRPGRAARRADPDPDHRQRGRIRPGRSASRCRMSR